MIRPTHLLALALTVPLAIAIGCSAGRPPGSAGGAVQDLEPQVQTDLGVSPPPAAASVEAKANVSPPSMSGAMHSPNVQPNINIGGGGVGGQVQVQPTGTVWRPPAGTGTVTPPIAQPAFVIRPTGMPVCDDYLKALRECSMKMQPDQRKAMEESIKHTAQAFADGGQNASSRPAMESACKSSHDLIRTSCFNR